MKKSPTNPRAIPKNRAGKAASSKTVSLSIRIDSAAKDFLTKAAALRGISVTDYVKMVTVVQARREVTADENDITIMTNEEQLTLWCALNEPVKLSPEQERLGKIMRGEA